MGLVHHLQAVYLPESLLGESQQEAAEVPWGVCLDACFYFFTQPLQRPQRGTWGQGGTKKETLSQLWSLSLVALVPYKADGGLQSTPRQAPSNQDPQGFFLNDSQSGESSQPLPRGLA